jgi:hypothetical protein
MSSDSSGLNVDKIACNVSTWRAIVHIDRSIGRLLP